MKKRNNKRNHFSKDEKNFVKHKIKLKIKFYYSLHILLLEILSNYLNINYNKIVFYFNFLTNSETLE